MKKPSVNVYILTFEIGISSGYKQLLGIYETKEKAEEVLEKHMRTNFSSRRNYFVNALELNKEVNITISEW